MRKGWMKQAWMDLGLTKKEWINEECTITSFRTQYIGLNLAESLTPSNTPKLQCV